MVLPEQEDLPYGLSESVDAAIGLQLHPNVADWGAKVVQHKYVMLYVSWIPIQGLMNSGVQEISRSGMKILISKKSFAGCLLVCVSEKHENSGYPHRYRRVFSRHLLI